MGRWKREREKYVTYRGKIFIFAQSINGKEVDAIFKAMGGQCNLVKPQDGVGNLPQKINLIWSAAIKKILALDNFSY